MATISVTLSEEQLLKVVEAYKTLQAFLAVALSPNEIYHADFLESLRESEEDIRSGHALRVTSFEDFVA